MPGYNCSIKERMLYSSCKAPLTDMMEQLGLQLVKKVSVNLKQLFIGNISIFYIHLENY